MGADASKPTRPGPSFADRSDTGATAGVRVADTHPGAGGYSSGVAAGLPTADRAVEQPEHTVEVTARSGGTSAAGG